MDMIWYDISPSKKRSPFATPARPDTKNLAVCRHSMVLVDEKSASSHLAVVMFFSLAAEITRNTWSVGKNHTIYMNHTNHTIYILNYMYSVVLFENL